MPVFRFQNGIIFKRGRRWSELWQILRRAQKGLKTWEKKNIKRWQSCKVLKNVAKEKWKKIVKGRFEIMAKQMFLSCFGKYLCCFWLEISILLGCIIVAEIMSFEGGGRSKQDDKRRADWKITQTRIYIQVGLLIVFVHIYICICVCVCVCFVFIFVYVFVIVQESEPVWGATNRSRGISGRCEKEV